MKTTLRSLFATALFVVLVGFGHQTQANHFQGSELTYTCVSPNNYVVNLKIYRDCSGAAAPGSASLRLSSNGCNPGRTIWMTQVGGSTIGNFYCPQLGPATCTAAGQPNFEEVVFTANVTFTAAEAQCADWVLSWSDCCRPNSANLVNPMAAGLYAEAHLKLKLPGTSTQTINNNSPVFNSMVVPFVNKFQPIVLSSNAIDPDGDSLVYSLKPALEDVNRPVTYGTFNPPNSVLVNPQNSSQFAFVTAANQVFSPTFPMPSYFVDWTLPAPRYAVKSFVLDPNNGTMMFTPSAYYANTPSYQGMNKYVVVVQVDEFRKINNVAVKVGHVRRDMFVTVMDCGPNQNPLLAAPVANGQPVTSTNIIELRPGTPLTFTFAANDNDPNDVLQLESNAATVLPGAVFTRTSGNRPAGTISWTPTTAHVRGQLYYFQVRVQDNACPVKGNRIETFAVRVSHNGGVTGLSADQFRIQSLQAFPNPFSENVQFQVNLAAAGTDQVILIYNSLGQLVDQIGLKGMGAGRQIVSWNKGATRANGQYLARLIDEKGVTTTIRFAKIK